MFRIALLDILCDDEQQKTVLLLPSIQPKQRVKVFKPLTKETAPFIWGAVGTEIKAIKKPVRIVQAAFTALLVLDATNMGFFIDISKFILVRG